MKNIAIIFLYVLLSGIGDVYGNMAFVANVNDNWELFFTNDQVENPIQLTHTPYDEKTPAWSSDHKKIVYATSDGHLNIINIVSKEIRQIALSDQNTAKMTPSLSTDGRKIAFAQFIPGKRDETDLMMFDMETKTTRKLLDQYAIQLNPVWSHDDSYLVYTNMHCSSSCGRLIQELWITSPDGGWARQLLMTHSLCQQPDWSPDGRQIVFSSDKSGNFDIWRVSLEDWNLKQITTHESLDVSPAWSPDGNRIAFVSTRSGIMEIWIKDLKNNELKKLNPFGNKKVECKDVAW